MDKVEVKRIEYLRDVDTNFYLPQVIGDADEVKRTNLAQDIELKNLWAMVNKQFYNRFILTADDEGLERYIKLLGQDITGTTEEKRRKVHYEWNKAVIYTDRSLRGLMDVLIGPEEYLMEILYSEYIVYFNVILKATTPNTEYIYRELREIIPANMFIRFTVTFMTDLIFESSFYDLQIPYYICGRHYTGTVYEYETRAFMVDEGLVFENRLDKRDYSYRLPSKKISQDEIYAVESKKMLDDVWVFDNNSGARLNYCPVINNGNPYD